jgi:hypothetical protein
MQDGSKDLLHELGLKRARKKRRKSVAFGARFSRKTQADIDRQLEGLLKPRKSAADGNRSMSQEAQLFMVEVGEDEIGELKWVNKWSWFVRAVLERDVLNAFGQFSGTGIQNPDRKPGELKRRVTLFGTVMQSYRVFHEHIDSEAWVYHFTEEIVEKEALNSAKTAPLRRKSLKNPPPQQAERNNNIKGTAKTLSGTSPSALSVSPLPSNAPMPLPSSTVESEEDQTQQMKRRPRRKSRRPSFSVEFHSLAQGEFMDELAVKYNSAQAHEDNQMYTASNLLRRESLQFDGRIMGSLQIIWDAFDEDHQYGITVDEYLTMHKAMFRACYQPLSEEDKEDEDEDESVWDDGGIKGWSKVLATLDWDKDREGHGCLNFERFKRCWFEMADRFTNGVSASEYAEFLEKMIRRMKLRRIGWSLEDERSRKPSCVWQKGVEEETEEEEEAEEVVEEEDEAEEEEEAPVLDDGGGIEVAQIALRAAGGTQERG